jgi:hypothetical protein
VGYKHLFTNFSLRDLAKSSQKKFYKFFGELRKTSTFAPRFKTTAEAVAKRKLQQRERNTFSQLFIKSRSVIRPQEEAASAATKLVQKGLTYVL